MSGPDFDSDGAGRVNPYSPIVGDILGYVQDCRIGDSADIEFRIGQSGIVESDGFYSRICASYFLRFIDRACRYSCKTAA